MVNASANPHGVPLSLARSVQYSVMSPRTPIAVLVSGGADSAVLLAELLGSHPRVHPLYVRCGFYWEESELAHLRRFLDAVRSPALGKLHILEMPLRDLYHSGHWSLTGENVPDGDTADDAVYLPGRNVLLLAKAMLWCHLNAVPELAMAPLEANPFPDATPLFFAQYEAVVNRAVAGSVRLAQPYHGLHKADVLRRGRDLPLELTFSCIRPVGGQHCGKCNKCAERRRAFAEAEVVDRTEYTS
jgi:7-cyano-7-deazaguanine synthase